MARTHYEVLGVARGATTPEMRRAYLDRARLLHPDRYIDAAANLRAEADRKMRDVNEAWRILGDTGRRAAYDRQLNGIAAPSYSAPGSSSYDSRFSSRSDGTMAEPIEHVDASVRLIRGLPWIALIIVLGLIFVFTAYAATGGNVGTPLSRCVSVGLVESTSSAVAPAERPTGRVPCSTPGARQVLVEVSTNQPCPPATERYQPPGAGVAYCLDP